MHIIMQGRESLNLFSSPTLMWVLRGKRNMKDLIRLLGKHGVTLYENKRYTLVVGDKEYSADQTWRVFAMALIGTLTHPKEEGRNLNEE